MLQVFFHILFSFSEGGLFLYCQPLVILRVELFLILASLSSLRAIGTVRAVRVIRIVGIVPRVHLCKRILGVRVVRVHIELVLWVGRRHLDFHGCLVIVRRVSNLCSLHRRPPFVLSNNFLAFSFIAYVNCLLELWGRRFCFVLIFIFRLTHVGRHVIVRIHHSHVVIMDIFLVLFLLLDPLTVLLSLVLDQFLRVPNLLIMNTIQILIMILPILIKLVGLELADFLIHFLILR